MEIEKPTTDKSKSILVVAVIILVGALFGMMGYLLGSKNNDNRLENQIIENQEADQSEIVEEEVVEEKDEKNSEEVVEDSQEEAVNWKTYTNEKSGYEIKYPSDWIIISDWKFITDATNMGINFCGPEYKSKTECSAGGKGDNPVIRLRDDMPDYAEKEYCTLNKESIFCKKDLILSQKNIKIASKNGIITEFKDINNGSIYANWKKNSTDEKSYELSVVGLKKYSNYRDIFNQMLSTLKFTN
jgi:hypothetical protein